MGIKADIERIERKYNPEFDTIPNQPSVTNTDMTLLEMIKSLLHNTNVLRNELKELRGEVSNNSQWIKDTMEIEEEEIEQLR